jgi:hypothetical protein
MPGGTAWIDTGALVALASPRDQYHARAVALAQSFRRAGGQWVSSVLVLAEFHWQMLRRGGAAVARSALIPVQADPAYRWLDVTSAIAARAVSEWLDRFHDQDFSLTDAVSFELMTREGLREAFAFDKHYLVAGFQLLR